MAFKLNIFTGTFDIDTKLSDNYIDSKWLKLDQTTPQTMTGDGSIIGLIPQLDSDPASPDQQTAWVLSEPVYSDGTPIGLLLAITQSAITGYTYALKYRTEQDTTITVGLT